MTHLMISGWDSLIPCFSTAPHLLGSPMGLHAGVKSTYQRHPVPRLSLEEPVIVKPLHKLILPLDFYSCADLVQPVERTLFILTSTYHAQKQ